MDSVAKSIFQGIVVISSTIKRPITKLLYWGQKAIEKTNKKTHEAELCERTYLGETFLSQLVACKAAEINGVIDDSREHVAGCYCEVRLHCDVCLEWRQHAGWNRV